MVSPNPLLFFGGKLQIEIHGPKASIVVDDWIKFACTAQTASLIQKLRKELDEYLEYKISHPGPSKLDSNCKESILLRAITDLITNEDILSCESTRVDEDEFEDNDDDVLS